MSDTIVIENDDEFTVIEMADATPDIAVVQAVEEFTVIELGEQGPPGPPGTGGITGNLPFANITNTPTTLAGYGITDGLAKIPNVDYGTANIPHYISGPPRPFAGDVAVSSDSTTYSGFVLNNGEPRQYVAGETRIVGTDFYQAEVQADHQTINFAYNQLVNDATGQPVSQVYSSSFQIGNNGFQAFVSDANFNAAAIAIGPTGSFISAGVGNLDLDGEDVTVQVSRATPGPYTVLNRTMADALYQPIVRKN